MAASGGYWLACSGKEIYARYLSTKNFFDIKFLSLCTQLYFNMPLFYCSRCSVVGSLGVIHMGIGVVSLMEKLGVESRVIIFQAGSVIVNMTNMVR